MIKATLNTPSGLSVNIEIPESAKEIPFSKYVSANIEYVSICERFDEQKTNYTGAQLNDIVRFLSFVLDIDAKIILGFKVGKLNDIAAKMAGGLDAKGTWEEVDVTLYMYPVPLSHTPSANPVPPFAHGTKRTRFRHGIEVYCIMSSANVFQSPNRDIFPVSSGFNNADAVLVTLEIAVPIMLYGVDVWMLLAVSYW